MPLGTFTDPVVVRDREYSQQMYQFDTEVDADLSVLDDWCPITSGLLWSLPR